MEMAQTLARNLGGETLEMTPTGQALNSASSLESIREASAWYTYRLGLEGRPSGASGGGPSNKYHVGWYAGPTYSDVEVPSYRLGSVVRVLSQVERAAGALSLVSQVVSWAAQAKETGFISMGGGQALFVGGSKNVLVPAHVNPLGPFEMVLTREQALRLPQGTRFMFLDEPAAGIVRTGGGSSQPGLWRVHGEEALQNLLSPVY